MSASGERTLLFGSESLTDEEEKLRAELLDWLVEKALAGHRPVPLQAALRIMSDFAGGYNGGQDFWNAVRKKRASADG